MSQLRRTGFKTLVPVVLETTGLTLEPLRVEHAAEMTAVLNDSRLHTFIGGSPATEPQLRRAYEHQVRGRSEGGDEVWLNWIVREDSSGQAVGYVQATVGISEDHADPVVAHLAWVIGVAHQGQRVASRASVAMAEFLRDAGVTAQVADVHPSHAASQAVARRLGMHPTNQVIDGEVRWACP